MNLALGLIVTKLEEKRNATSSARVKKITDIIIQSAKNRQPEELLTYMMTDKDFLVFIKSQPILLNEIILFLNSSEEYYPLLDYFELKQKRLITY